MLITEIFEALDAATTPATPATLAGLSITASSFLFNLLKEANQKLKPYQERLDATILSFHKDDTPGIDCRRQRIYDRKAEMQPYKDIVDDISWAIKSLLIAFAAFVVDLILSLSLDPLIDQSLTQGKGAIATQFFSFASSHAELLPWDVGLSTGALAIGIGFLINAATRMFSIVSNIHQLN